MDDFDKKIREIMIHRKPEHFLDDIFMNLTVYINNKRKNNIYYKKDDKLLFQYNINQSHLWYSDTILLEILKTYYNSSYLYNNIISNLIKNKFEKYIELPINTINSNHLDDWNNNLRHLKLKV